MQPALGRMVSCAVIVASLVASLVATAVAPVSARERRAPLSPDAAAEATLRRMTLDEKLTLLTGFIPALMPAAERPTGITQGAGFVPGVPRLGIPYLVESDAGLGVANMGEVMRAGNHATAFPSGAAMASTWDAALAEHGGRALGAEARGEGINVQLAGGMNLVREPRNGRNFEYLGKDALLAGVLGGRIIRGIQSNGVVSTIKHYALNAQETGRTSLSVEMGEAAMRESDPLAFEIGIEIGNPGSVMCAYNRVNGVYACENPFLLNDVLRHDWGFKGWVMSDWGAVHSTSIRQGLDQESGTRFGQGASYFGRMLRADLAAGRIGERDIDASVRRILRTMNRLGVTRNPIRAEASIDYEANGRTAQTLAENGIVLLKNVGGLLPLASTARRILLIGGHADIGVMQGGGSSQVSPVGGAALGVAISGDPAPYHRRLYSLLSPLKKLRALLPGAQIGYDDGTDPAHAAAAARSADVAIVFAEQFTAEGSDVATLNLPDRQDALIDAVAAANPRSIVVLETGGPALMPWVDKVGAVLAAWYPGQRGGAAIARILTGAANPSGRLPITFPRSIDQTPNPRLPGSTLVKGQSGEDIYELPKNPARFDNTYPEGADVGYRWYDRQGVKPLFAFGHGLSFTSFAYSGLAIGAGTGLTVAFRVANTGTRTGTETAQVYVTVNGARRLVGWQRVTLAPGVRRQLSVTAEPRLLAAFDVTAHNWRIDAGTYKVEVSSAVDRPLLTRTARLAARRIKP